MNHTAPPYNLEDRFLPPFSRCRVHGMVQTRRGILLSVNLRGWVFFLGSDVNQPGQEASHFPSFSLGFLICLFKSG